MDVVPLAMPGQTLPFEQRCQPDAFTVGAEDAPAVDYLIHSWEAPTATSACCEGRFSGPQASCAFAQQGGVAFLDAGRTGNCSAHDMHCFDRIDSVQSIRIPGAHLLSW